MKKNISFVVSLAAFLFCIVYSCTYEQMHVPFDEVKENLIKDAMKKFNELSSEEGLIEMRSTKDAADISVKPMWEYAKTHEDKNSKVVEIPLTSENYFSFATPEAMAKFKETGDRRYRLSKTSFVYIVNKTSKYEDMFMMTVVPELSYTESTRFKPFNNMSYLDRDKSFNGLIFYHNMKGEYVNGWRYTDGKVTHTINAHTEKPDFDVVNTRSFYCYDQYMISLWERCTYTGYYDNGGEFILVNTECRNWYELEYWYTQCYSGDSGGGYYYDYGGGSNGNGNNNVSVSNRPSCKKKTEHLPLLRNQKTEINDSSRIIQKDIGRIFVVAGDFPGITERIL